MIFYTINVFVFYRTLVNTTHLRDNSKAILAQDNAREGIRMFKECTDFMLKIK